ncbi:MAG: Nif3-like dinuclear metal center hexameric protein, partial [Opitutaceae bacterium]
MSAPTLADLAAYCDQRTRRSEFQDAPGACNGLQFANDGRAGKIGAAVDAGLEPFRRAVAQGVDFLIVHHGMYWDMPRPLTGPAYERIATLVRGNCALYSCHLPLDAHPEIGNNALLARQLDLAPSRGFLPNEGGPVGRVAANDRPRSALRTRLQSLYPRLVALEFGSERPAEIAFCSGSGGGALGHLGAVDTLVTGELREEHFNRAQEERLNLYACGHYA